MEDLSLWIIIAQIINFGIIFFIFYYFLWNKIVKIIEERKQFLDSLSNSDFLVKQKLEKADNEAQNIIIQAKQTAFEIQKNSENLVKNETRQKLQEAEIKARGLEEEALRNIEKERLSMIDALKQRIIDISLQINAKIFDNSDKNKDFIQKEITWIKI